MNGHPYQNFTRYGNGVQLVTADTINPKGTDWLWKGYLAKSKIAILAGPPGTGKTAIALSIAAAITTGGVLPDGTISPRGNVLVWTGEDGIEDTIVPRLIAAGADRHQIHFIEGTARNGRIRKFDFATDIPNLSVHIDDIQGGIDLIIIDSIVQAVGANSNKNEAVRKGLEPLVELAERHNCAILGITHLNKKSKNDEPIERINGSIAYGAVARIVLLTAKVQSEVFDEGPARCVLVRAKSNLGNDDGGFLYQIAATPINGPCGIIDSSKVIWNDSPLQGSAKEILQHVESSNPPESGSAVQVAMDFLKKILATGPMSNPAVHDAAKKSGISEATLRRAKLALGIQSKKQVGYGQHSAFAWSLPTPQPGLSRDWSAPITGGPQFLNSGFDTRFPAVSMSDIIQSSYSPALQQRNGSGVMSKAFNALPVDPLEPLEPLEPVEPVEPVDKSFESLYGQQLLESLIFECRRTFDRYSSKLHDSEDLMDRMNSIIDDAIDNSEYMGTNEGDAQRYRNALYKALQ